MAPSSKAITAETVVMHLFETMKNQISEELTPR